MLLARRHLFISLASAQAESGWSNLGMLLARLHLFISLASAQREYGWDNLGMLLARQHLFISLESAQRDLSFDGSLSKIFQICGTPKSYSDLNFFILFFFLVEMPLYSCIIMPKILIFKNAQVIILPLTEYIGAKKIIS